MRKTTRFNEYATLQSTLSTRELSNEILFLSWINMVNDTHTDPRKHCLFTLNFIGLNCHT